MRNLPGLLPVLAILIALPLFLSGQPATFTRVFYDMNGTAQVYATIATPDHNFLIAGERNGQPLVMKIDEEGNFIWQKRLVLPESRFFCAATTHDGGYLVAGKVMNPAPALADMLCVRLTTAGDTLWSRSVNMGVEDLVFSVKETADHGVIMAGYSDTDGNSAVSIAVVKLDSAGNLLWGRTFYSGNSANVARGIDQTPDGGYVITGSIANASPYREGLILMKLTADGELSWIKRQALATSDYSQGFDVKAIPGGLILNGSATNAGVGLIKTDLSGNVIWSKGYTWSTTIYYGTPGPKLSTTAAGGFQFVQFLDMFGPGGAARTDSSGNLLWSSSIVVISNSALETSDGGCLVTGNGPIWGVDLSPSDWPQIGLVKTDTTGNSSDCVWGGGFEENPNAIVWEIPPVTSTNNGTLTKIHPPLVDGADLSVSTGCVTVFGGEAEDSRLPNSLIISPNPTDGNFMVRMEKPDSGEISSLEILNAMGSLVYRSSDVTLLPLQVRLSNPPVGIYLLRAVCGGRAYTQKLVVCKRP